MKIRNNILSLRFADSQQAKQVEFTLKELQAIFSLEGKSFTPEETLYRFIELTALSIANVQKQNEPKIILD